MEKIRAFVQFFKSKNLKLVYEKVYLRHPMDIFVTLNVFDLLIPTSFINFIQVKKYNS